MKGKTWSAKALALLLALCMALSLVCVTATAADPAAATTTADFTVGQGQEAIKLLNQYKTGTADSLWDNATKTLTLWGVKFTTAAATAVKLPAGATIVLKDGTHNTIRSGDVNLEVSGAKNSTFINALDAAGSLTIEGGTGSLSVYAGALKNKGDAWVYSSAIAVNGDFTVKGGRVTARGGSVESNDSCFSIGVNMDSNKKNKALLVTGGTLTAIADEAYELEEGGTKSGSFSRGVYMYQGNVTVSGSGKLHAESVKEMADATLLSNGLYISVGNLTVANSAEVAVAGAEGAYISGGNITVEGGRFAATTTRTDDTSSNALTVTRENIAPNSGNITVSGGTLETVTGKIYMSTFGAEENQGLFTVTGGSVVNQGRLYGPKKLTISGGSVQTKGVEAKELNLSGGTLTIREPVHKSPNSDELYALPALNVSTLTVSGGTLDAAWDWGAYTPVVLPKDEKYNDVGILVRLPYEFNTATFTGGTTLLDTGFAGNTALLLKGTLTIANGMEETGADANHCQLDSSVPVKIAASSLTIKVIDVVEISGVTVSFKDGDKPVFTGKTPDGVKYKYDCEWWELDSKTGAISSDFFSSAYENKVTNFEAGKTYHYGVYVKAVGYVESENTTYVFGPNTKLKINGEFVNYKRYEGDLSDGSDSTMWVLTDLTMTPAAQSGGNTTPGGNTPTTGDSGVLLWVVLTVTATATAALALHQKKRARK